MSACGRRSNLASSFDHRPPRAVTGHRRAHSQRFGQQPLNVMVGPVVVEPVEFGVLPVTAKGPAVCGVVQFPPEGVASRLKFTGDPAGAAKVMLPLVKLPITGLLAGTIRV